MIMNNETLKVLLVSPLPPPVGGIATWTQQYINWSKENNLKVEIVNTAFIGSRAKKINGKVEIIDEIKRTFKIISEMSHKIKRFKPSIVHLNTPCGKFGIIRDYICVLLAKMNKVKIVIHYRCNIKDQVKNSRLSNFFLSKISQSADINFVLNSDSKNYLSQLTECKSELVSNFIEEIFILGNTKEIKKEITEISFVGHVQGSKGVFEIFEVAKKYPHVIFKLAGPISDEVMQIVKPPNIILLGSLEKALVRDLLLNSDIFLFPSYTEGFANSLLEAMAMGVPVITTAVGANKDMIESKGGVIVEVGDEIGIIRAIEEMHDSFIRNSMSEWNIEKVRGEYTVHNVMGKLISLYEKELNKVN